MEMPVIESVSDLYGPALETASRTDLMAIVSAVGLELECRHCNGNIPDGLADLIQTQGDEKLLTLAIAAALRLRMPIQSVTLSPVWLQAA